MTLGRGVKMPEKVEKNIIQPIHDEKTYQVTFDRVDSKAVIEGWRLTLDGLPIRLEDVGSSELLLFEAR